MEKDNTWIIWDNSLKEDVVIPPHVENFIEDLLEVYRKHNLSLGHEDDHGAFIVRPLSDDNIEWLEACQLDLR